MRRAKLNRPDATGRNSKRLGSDGAVIILRRSFWLSPQVSALSVTARALLVELTAMYTGPACNGKLFLSQVDAAQRLGLSDRKAVKAAFAELEGVGLLSCTLRGDFRVKAGGLARASAFRLNWKSDSGSPLGTEALPALDFSRFDARQKQRVSGRSKVMAAFTRVFFAGEDSSHWAAVRAYVGLQAGMETPHASRENGGNALAVRWEESSQHVYYHGVRGRRPSDISASMRGCDPAAVPFVTGPVKQQTPFCRLIAMRRSINMSPKKIGPARLLLRAVSRSEGSRTCRAPVLQ